jgi:hypothetical protein
MNAFTAKKNATVTIGALNMASSRFPVPFTIVRVNPVKPEMTIREAFGDVTVERKVRFSVYRHACRVHGVTIVSAK